MAESASSARAAAVALLESLHGAPDDTPLPVLVDRVARRQNLDIRDTALLTELICGVLRTEKRLWALLKPFLRKPDSLPKPLRFLLLTAAYELLFLDHIPSRATVHQAVSLAGRRYGSALGGVANAVLRALDRDLDRVRAEDASFLARDPELATVDDVERLGSLPSDSGGAVDTRLRSGLGLGLRPTGGLQARSRLARQRRASRRRGHPTGIVESGRTGDGTIRGRLSPTPRRPPSPS